MYSDITISLSLEIALNIFLWNLVKIEDKVIEEIWDSRNSHTMCYRANENEVESVAYAFAIFPDFSIVGLDFSHSFCKWIISKVAMGS